MKERASSLTDDDYRDILFWDREVGHSEMGRRLGIHAGTILKIRKLESFRAIRVARELGLIALGAPRVVFMRNSDKPVKVSARVAARRDRFG